MMMNGHGPARAVLLDQLSALQAENSALKGALHSDPEGGDSAGEEGSGEEREKDCKI